jgi:hypothetical protein
MKKTFQLEIEGRHRDRVVDALKHELRKYVGASAAAPCPPAWIFWTFDCRFGLAEAGAEPAHLSGLGALIDAAARDGARAGLHRDPGPPGPPPGRGPLCPPLPEENP